MNELAGSAPHQRLDAARRRLHADCFACGQRDVACLQLRCASAGDDGVEAAFNPQPWMCGYADCLHGGIIAAVLDSAMTQCLFARGIAAVTATMEVRFLFPAPPDQAMRVTAHLCEQRHEVYCMRAEISVGEVGIARATARFVPIQS